MAHITEYIECRCTSHDHVLRFTKFEDDEDDDVYLGYFLRRDKNFFKRIAIAFKYIFGVGRKVGTSHFSDVVLGEKESKRIINFLSKAHNL